MPLNGNSKIRTCEMQKRGPKAQMFLGLTPCIHPRSDSIVSKIIANFSYQCASCTCRMKKWPLMSWNLGDYVEKVLKNNKKTAQKLKMFTKIYYTLGLAMLESILLGDFDLLESTN